MKKKHFYSVVISIFFVFIAFGSDEKENTESQVSMKPPQKIEDKIEPDSLKSVLRREAASIDKGFDGSKYKSSVEGVQLELVLFSLWRGYIEQGLASGDSEAKGLAQELKKRVVALQIKEFPKM